MITRIEKPAREFFHNDGRIVNLSHSFSDEVKAVREIDPDCYVRIDRFVSSGRVTQHLYISPAVAAAAGLMGGFELDGQYCLVKFG